MKQKLLNLFFIVCTFSMCITHAQNTISVPTNPFGGAFDDDGMHQISTTDYGDFTFLTTDDGLSTGFASLTPILGNLGRGLAHPSGTGQSGEGIGYVSFAGDGENGYWFVFARNGGGEFKLTQLDVLETYFVFTTMEIVGFLDGTQVVAEEVTITLGTNTPNIPLTDTGFQNIDEVRIRQKTDGFYNNGILGLEGTYFNNIVLDDAVTSCPPPTALSSFAQGETIAIAAWFSGGTSMDFNLIYGVSGFDPNTSGTSVDISVTNYSFTGLNAGTTYDYYVRESCGNGSFSDFVQDAFTTDGVASSQNINLSGNCEAIFDGDYVLSDNINDRPSYYRSAGGFDFTIQWTGTRWQIITSTDSTGPYNDLDTPTPPASSLSPWIGGDCSPVGTFSGTGTTNTLSVNNLEENLDSTRIYPNPAKNSITIATDVKTVTVFDVFGKRVLQSNQNKVDISGLQSGMYLLEIITDKDNKLVKRLIKE